MIKPWIRVVTMGIFALRLSACQGETVGISSIDEKGNRIEGTGYTFTMPDGSFLSIETSWETVPRMAWISKK